MGFFRQTWTLAKKDLKIVAQRRWLSTFLRAVALPVSYIFFIAYVRNFFLPPSEYGIGVPRPIRNLTTEVFGSSTSLGGRDRVAFINNGYTGGQIEELILTLASPLEEAGADVRILSNDDELLQVCRSSLRGLSRCYAAASFHASPTEGQGGTWSYTARTDFALGLSVWVSRPDNAAQVYVLPFIHAIDSAIAQLSGGQLPEMIEYPFTHETIQDRNNTIQAFFMRALVNYLAVTLFIGICGIAYHLPGHVATERELGMSSLIDAMTPSRRPWKSLTARVSSAYISFAAIYLAGWIGMGVIVSRLIFYHTATSIVVLFHILVGLSLTGYSIMWTSLFRRAQLSGITVLLASLALAVISQFIPRPITTVAVLSVLFPPVTYTSFMIYLAGWERNLDGANLMQAAPYSSTNLGGYTYFVFLVIQIVAFPFLAALLQWALYSHSQYSRRPIQDTTDATAFRLLNVSKFYAAGPFRRLFTALGTSRPDSIKAVDDISLSAFHGTIVTLLGANGSGKSTTISMMAGTNSVTKGIIEMDHGQGLGICPQNNVLWGELTVMEHVKIFNGLKTTNKLASKHDLTALITACDLSHKLHDKSRTLSGGQKRKLQLAMAFTGDSKICCIDEVSSGLDPLSRRVIWQILLAERGRRTILITTHALDEADALSDHIAVMSKGKIIAEGSAVELKHRFGGGYHITKSAANVPKDAFDRAVRDRGTAFRAANSFEASQIAAQLEASGAQDITVEGPSMEDVFLNLARDYEEELAQQDYFTDTPRSRNSSDKEVVVPVEGKKSQNLAHGRGTSFLTQVWILFRKRCLILTRNYLPYLFAVILPVLTAGLTIMFLGGFDRLICSPSQLANNPQVINLGGLELYWGILVSAGPRNRFSESQLPATYRPYLSRVAVQDSFEDFQAFIRANFRDVMPGGFYLGANATTSPLVTYRIDGNLGYAALAKNVIDSILLNTTIQADFSTFALPFIPSIGDSLQLVLYFGFSMCVFPAFFALYPTFERLGNIRALHYSNGIRPASLWLSYILFDSMFVILVSIVTVVLFTSLADVWFAPGYLFVVFWLFGTSSTLLSYIISLFTTTQLAAFAFAAGGQAVFLLVYFIMYMVFITFTQVDRLYEDLNTVQFAYGLFTPSGNLLRSLLLALNQSQLLCRGQQQVSYPGELTVYGGPVFYLMLQNLAFYAVMVCYDSGWLPRLTRLQRRLRPKPDSEKAIESSTPDVRAETERVERSNDALRVLHLSKRFGSNTVIDDISFGVRHGEILALLGPNGAGKTSAIDVIRGRTRPSTAESDVRIEAHPMLTARTTASRFLGVCPQFDTMDRMTVTEHLSFYARVRGVPDVQTNVTQVIAAVRLAPFRHRLSAKLSGGNQRKLSLATAIIGNPSVLLLDEPSSGMDAVAKRVMWKVISAISPGRSMVITTHSMEEASALASRAAIMAKRLLAIGDIKTLSKTRGEGLYHVHVFLRGGATITLEEERRLADWVKENFDGAVLTQEALHGQMKFTVPSTSINSKNQSSKLTSKEESISQDSGPVPRSNGIVSILQLLEKDKDALGIEYYSISETTLEDVFLTIVGKERRLEEAI